MIHNTHPSSLERGDIVWNFYFTELDEPDILDIIIQTYPQFAWQLDILRYCKVSFEKHPGGAPTAQYEECQGQTTAPTSSESGRYVTFCSALHFDCTEWNATSILSLLSLNILWPNN